MFKTHAHRTMDMTEGSLLTKVLFFSLPIMLSGILQLLFNAADTIVVGRFAGNEALAAVGSVGSLNNMIISLFVGLSIGVNVLVARFTGAKDAVERAIAGHSVLHRDELGGMAIASIVRQPGDDYGDLQVDPVPLQKLFVYLTEGGKL